MRSLTTGLSSTMLSTITRRSACALPKQLPPIPHRLESSLAVREMVSRWLPTKCVEFALRSRGLPSLAELAREHNNANVVSIGARMHTTEESLAIIDAFLATPYSNEDRHTRRIEMLSAYEVTHELPPLGTGHKG